MESSSSEGLADSAAPVIQSPVIRSYRANSVVRDWDRKLPLIFELMDDLDRSSDASIASSVGSRQSRGFSGEEEEISVRPIRPPPHSFRRPITPRVRSVSKSYCFGREPEGLLLHRSKFRAVLDDVIARNHPLTRSKTGVRTDEWETEIFRNSDFRRTLTRRLFEIRRPDLPEVLPQEGSLVRKFQIRSTSDLGIVCSAFRPRPIESTRIEKVTCNICFEEFVKESEVQPEWCSDHFSCVQCTKEYVRHSILDGKLQIGCVIGQQCQFVASNEAIIARAGGDLYGKLKMNRAHAEFNFECTVCHNKHFSLAHFDVRIKNCDKFVCDRCAQNFCLFCRVPVDADWKRSFPNLTFPKRHVCEDEDARKMMRHVLEPYNQVRTCPHCFRFTHRYEGCPNMVCSGALGCNQAYCWDCLLPFNHASVECHAYLYPPRMSDFALRAVSRVVCTAGQVAVQSIKTTGVIIASPLMLCVSYHRRRERERIWLQQDLQQSGFDVYCALDGIPNDAADPHDDQEAINLVDAFATNTVLNGRWCENARCWLSYDAGNFGHDGVIVRLHPHGPGDHTCALQAPSSLNYRPVQVVVSDAVPENVVDQVRRGCKDALRRHRTRPSSVVAT